jgi:hypothetical protein
LFFTLLASLQYLSWKNEKLMTEKICFHSWQQQESFQLNQTQTETAGHAFSFAMLQGVLSSVV